MSGGRGAQRPMGLHRRLGPSGPSGFLGLGPPRCHLLFLDVFPVYPTKTSGAFLYDKGNPYMGLHVLSLPLLPLCTIYIDVYKPPFKRWASG